MKVTCEECERVFDLLDEADQNEWNYGHDCEVYDPCEGERYAEFVASWVSGGGSPGEASQAFNQFVLGHEPPNPYEGMTEMQRAQADWEWERDPRNW